MTPPSQALQLIAAAPPPCAAEPVSRDSPTDALDRAAHSILAAASYGWSPVSTALAWADWWAHLSMAPGKCSDLAARAYLDALANLHLAQGSTDVALEGSGDPRFKAPAWSNRPFSDWRDAFLRTQAWWRDATTDVRGVESHHQQTVSFDARQWLDSLAPSNFPALNPQVLATTLESGGANLVRGLRNWLEDLEDGAAHLGGVASLRRPTLRVGQELAISPGEVVWRNELLELIQYTPSTPNVALEPILIVPSWILKYYILDLQPHDSLVRYLVDAGYTVFMISWQNPDHRARNRGLNDYLEVGLLPALAEVRQRCGDAAVHAIGYCLGGTLLAIGAAALARDRAATPLRSVTLLAAETDFSEPGELGLFIDASELAALDALMWEQGYLDGTQMAAAFQVLNSRDLIWSRMMSEYLLGVRSKPDDLSSWNADTTRMPYRMHSEYLHRLFLQNELALGQYCVGGRPVALSDVRQPWFVVGTERDHVSPWRSVYKLHLLTQSDLTFLLTSRGHNAGIVSPPGLPQRYYRVAQRSEHDPYRSPQSFFEQSVMHDGSWWPRLVQWLDQHSSAKVSARQPLDGLCAAPGNYVLGL